jgi:hypothetical protein
MYKYTVYKEADNEKFKETCKKIVNGVNNLTANEPIIDVDGSTIQKYDSPNGNIKVCNDYEIDAVYIDSEVNLDDVLKNII